jgi:hypothetical protein
MIPKMDEGVDPAVAQELQDRLDRLNETSVAEHNVPHFLASYRHACEGARQSKLAGKGVSTNIDTGELYVEHADGVHALLYREGTCKKCHQVARSKQGRVVLIAQRPPVSNRVARD